MDREEAVRIATGFIKDEQIDIAGLAAVRKIKADLLPEPYRAAGDCWIVEFSRRIPPDVVESPDCVLISVNDKTGVPTVEPVL